MCAAYVLGGVKGSCKTLRRKWRATMEDFDPDTFSTYQRLLREETPVPTLKSCLALLRVAHWDSELFFRLRRHIINQSPNATRKQRGDMLTDAQRVWANAYPMDTQKDIAFELGRVMMGLKRYVSASEFFALSNTHCGEHHVTYYNLAIVTYQTSQQWK